MVNGVGLCKMLELTTDAYIDHHLIAATINLKANKSNPKKPPAEDIAKLQYPKKNKEFVLELRNRFSMPEASSEM